MLVKLDFPHKSKYVAGPMATATLDEAAFLGADCPQCKAEVLTYIDLDEFGQFTHHCLTCGSQISEDFREVAAEELSELGYEVLAARTCGNGGGCGVGGCGTRGTR